MKIFATGAQRRLDELKNKIGRDHLLETVEQFEEHIFDPARLMSYDLLFDLSLDDDPHRLRHYSALENKIVIGCAVKITLAQLKLNTGDLLKCELVGMNALPTFIDRQKLEISFHPSQNSSSFDMMAKQLNWDYMAIADQVGMVTPRVITMIINEACLALDEGTASMEDIDKAMKLGTNYPFGPFEWCDRIGIRDVYETLEAIRIYSRDDRYKISSLLRHKYQDRAKFYNS